MERKNTHSLFFTSSDCISWSRRDKEPCRTFAFETWAQCWISHLAIREFLPVQCLTYLGRDPWYSCLVCQHSALEVLRGRQLELELFGLDPARHRFSSVFQADMDILMCQQPFPCHQLAGTSHLAPAKAAQSNPVWPNHSCLTLAP